MLIFPIFPETLPAYGFAACAHRHQKRKYSEKPYVSHCLKVAQILTHYTADVTIISAALLHDVVEDTDVTFEEIEVYFGSAVAGYVKQVTNVSMSEEGNRQQRKEIELEHLARTSTGGASIKLADIVDNILGIVESDPEFAKIYLPEKRKVIDVLKHGNQVLWKLAERTIDCAEDRLTQLNTNGYLSI